MAEKKGAPAKATDAPITTETAEKRLSNAILAARYDRVCVARDRNGMWAEYTWRIRPTVDGGGAP